MKQQERIPSESREHAAAEIGLGTPIAAATMAIGEDTLDEAASSLWGDAFRRFRQNWAAVVSLIVVIILVLVAILAPFLHTTSPINLNYTALDQAPSGSHWFGTDGLGRDQYSRLLYGLRIPLMVGIVGAAVTVILGTFIGLFAGYYGGIMDALLARFADLMFAFPGFTLVLIVVTIYGTALDPYFAGGGRVLVLGLVLAMVGWPGIMRLVRSLVLSLVAAQFVEAARTVGTSNWKIITRHLLPNIWGVVLVQASFVVVGFVYTEAVLSIFGVGVEPPNPDLGQMLFDGASHLGLNMWEAVIPSIFLTVIILAFTFLGDGLRDAIDPKMDA